MVLEPRILEALRELGVQIPQDFDLIRTAPNLIEAQKRLSALKDRIHKSFRRLAFELHPDRTGGDDAKTERFKLLTQVKDDIEKLRIQQAPRPQRVVMHMWTNPVGVGSTSVNGSTTTSVYTSFYQGTTTASPTYGTPLRVVVMKPI